LPCKGQKGVWKRKIGVIEVPLTPALSPEGEWTTNMRSRGIS